MTQNIIDNELTNSSSGSTETWTLQNTSNTASSSAELEIIQAGSSGDDVWTEYRIGTTRSYALGINESNANALEFTIGTTSTNPSAGNGVLIYRVSTSTLNWTDQPCFQAYKSSNTTNATGDGTAFTIDASTERFDVGSDYNNSTYTFTAPVTGKYLLFMNVKFSNLGGGQTFGRVFFNTSNFGYAFPSQVDPGAYTETGIAAMIYADMDASDTADFQTNIYNGTKTATVNGNATITTFIGGALIK